MKKIVKGFVYGTFAIVAICFAIGLMYGNLFALPQQVSAASKDNMTEVYMGPNNLWETWDGVIVQIRNDSVLIDNAGDSGWDFVAKPNPSLGYTVDDRVSGTHQITLPGQPYVIDNVFHHKQRPAQKLNLLWWEHS